MLKSISNLRSLVFLNFGFILTKFSGEKFVLMKFLYTFFNYSGLPNQSWMQNVFNCHSSYVFLD